MRRDSKYMKQSPVSKHHYCFRSVKGFDFNPTCFEKHINEQIKIKN